MTLAVGTKAPDFSGTLQDGRAFHSSETRGKPLVLYFYPKDFTPGCTREACEFRDIHAELARVHDARIVGVSRDSPATHARFAQEHKLPFELLSDPDATVARAFGALHLGGLLPLVQRVTYVIDSGGTVRGVFHHELRIGKHVADVQACLQALA